MRQEHRDVLKEICEEHPEYYLDEFANELFCRTGYVFHIATICRVMKKMNYSLQVCYHSAAQRDQEQRDLYMDSLYSLVDNPSQLIFIDETHKDRNASRRKRAYAKKWWYCY